MSLRLIFIYLGSNSSKKQIIYEKNTKKNRGGKKNGKKNWSNLTFWEQYSFANISVPDLLLV